MAFRKIILMLTGILLSVSCSGEQKKEVKNNQAMNGSKVLIVFFSHAGENYSVGNVKVGNTKLIADEIQKRTGGDEFEIVAEKSYDMPYSQLIEIAKEETKRGEKPAFKGEVKNIEQYDTIFIGGPIWWGTYPQVMFTFFDKYDLNGKTIIPFTTHEGSGLANTVADVKRAYPKAKVMEGFAVYGHEVRTDMSKVNTWLNGLGY
ncbi:flavodoxin [Prevotella sp. HMSC073D09]|uniref:flavodoxin n=1 Tax=Prevotella sp. HMSC073D09 TaxID=1739459 RepID=UPI0008A4818F|nr:flavodoxin [Prevotella sp. HMSC073D09]OFQ14510.1 flavodoxin [Prevotella sp. HMSC073D09]